MEMIRSPSAAFMMWMCYYLVCYCRIDVQPGQTKSKIGFLQALRRHDFPPQNLRTTAELLHLSHHMRHRLLFLFALLALSLSSFAEGRRVEILLLGDNDHHVPKERFF